MKQGPTGLQARLASTAGITALLAVHPDTGDPRIQEGWPAEELEEPHAAAFPQLTYELPTIKPLAEGVAEMSGTINAFTWYQQRDRLDEIEAAIRTLDQVHWRHGGARVQAFLGTSIDDPARKPDEPEHRVIPITLLVSEE